MNIYEKLQKCRVELQSKDLKKSGENKFAKYSYYELGDFLPTINLLFDEHKLFSRVKFDSEIAQMDIVNSEKPDEIITFTSPMASANLKGCHEIQNLGAVQTYQRRYLYMAALEIVEHDALDGTLGADKAPSQPRSSKGDTKTPAKPAKPLQKDIDPDNLFCVDCGKQIDQKVYSYSMEKNKKPLCFNCQKAQK